LVKGEVVVVLLIEAAAVATGKILELLLLDKVDKEEAV
jgi:hypothetical protein